MFDNPGLESVPYRVVVDGVERLHRVNRRNPHFDSPLMEFSVQSSGLSQSDLSLGKNARTLHDLRVGFDRAWDKSKLVVQDSRKQFVQRWQSTNRAIISDVFFVPFFVDNFSPYSAPCFWSTAFLLQQSSLLPW